MLVHTSDCFLTRVIVKGWAEWWQESGLILFNMYIVCVKQGSRKVLCSPPPPQVKTLKEKIEQEKGKDHFSVSGLKLIYAGMLQAVFNPS